MNTATKSTSIPENKNFFHTTINKFFDSNDEAGHISFLTDLCRAFTGITIDPKLDTGTIANGVFSANVITGFLTAIEESYLSNEPWMTVDEGELIGNFLVPIGSKTAVDIINTAVVMWIHPDEPEHTIEYLQHSMQVFSNVSELIKVCNKINNHYLFTMEGGVSC